MSTLGETKTTQDLLPEALELASRALTEHAACFWMRRPDSPLRDRSDVVLVIRRLRENGGPAAWRMARQIEACL